MKKLYTILVAVLLTTISFAQTPELMSYQAVVRDAANALVSNQTVGMRISILQGTALGAAVYTETQTPTSNANGLVTLEIGTGTSSDYFSAIDWSAGTYFIKTETDPTGGTSYTITGTSQLLSVPYALYAKVSGSSIPGPQGIQGETGAQGIQGPVGATGPAGADGLTSSVNGITQISGAITLTKADIGLGNVDNTSDANKPVSSASQTALDLKVDKEAGKGLSINDYTTAEQTKLAAISGNNTGDNAVNSNYSSLVTNATHTGDVIGATALTITNNAVTTDKILNGNVTDAKIAAVATSKLTGAVGIANGGTNITTYTQGDILYASSATQLTVLVKGTDGQVLTMNAGATAPEWVGGATLAIGDTYAGGIIFYLDGSGQHGLVAKATDEPGAYAWSTTSLYDEYYLAFTFAAGIYGGAQNTKKLINRADLNGATSPVAIQASLSYGGYSDWYLPSKDELDMMYVNLHLQGLGNFVNNSVYWSSTEYDNDEAWVEPFGNGSQFYFRKSFTHAVRAVRAF